MDSVNDRDAEQTPNRTRTKRQRATGLRTVGVQVVTALVVVRLGIAAFRRIRRLTSPRTAKEARQLSTDEEEEQDLGEEGITARDQWLITSDPPPSLPPDAKLACEADLQILVYDFYAQFISIETSCLQDHHKSTGQFNFRASRWKQDGNSFTRTFEFKQPKKGIASVEAHCIQQQTFRVHAGGVLSLVTDMHMTNIPYKECFKVQSFWLVKPDSTGAGCHVSIHVAIPFIKWCMVKSMILNQSFNDCKQFFTDFLAKVQHSINTELPDHLQSAPTAVPRSPFSAADTGYEGAGAIGRPASHASVHRLDSHIISRKPSFCQHIDVLHLPGRRAGAWWKKLVVLQNIMLVLVLLVQLLTLYDNHVLRQQLAMRSLDGPV
eukprot:jgi/Chrzof1/9101/Cz03g36020.t1